MTNKIAISRLLSNGYNIFMPLTKHPDYSCIIEYANVIQTISIIPCHYPHKKASLPLARLVVGKPPRFRNSSLISSVCIVDRTTKRVWLIPFDDVSTYKCLGLGKRFDEYLLSEEAPSTIKKGGRLTEVAVEFARGLKKDD